MDGNDDAYADNRHDSLEEYGNDVIQDINQPDNVPQKQENNIGNIIDDHYHHHQQQQPHPHHHHFNGDVNNRHPEDDQPDADGEAQEEEDRGDNSESEDDEDQDGDSQGETDDGDNQHNNDDQQPMTGHDPESKPQELDPRTVPDQEDNVAVGSGDGTQDVTAGRGSQHDDFDDGDNQKDNNRIPREQRETLEKAQCGRGGDHDDDDVIGTSAEDRPRLADGNGAAVTSLEGVAPTTTGESTPTATMTPSTPPPSHPSSSSTPKSIKQRLSEIPKRLSRLSLLNALRSGTYVVSEPKDNVNDENDLEGQNNMADDGQPEDVDVDVDAGNDAKANNDKVGVAVDNGGGRDEALHKMEAGDADVAELNMTKRPHSVQRSALTRLLCGLYALILVVFGIVFALANSLTVKEREHLYYLEVFQIYLYAGSLAVLLYFQVCILRGVRIRNNYFESNIRVVIRRSHDNLQLTPSPTRKQNHDENHQGHSIVLTDAEEALLDSRRDPMDQLSTLSTRSQLGLPADGEVAHVGEGINFYLRLGALAFSIGSVTLDGFHIASYFETDNTTTCESLIFIFVYVLHLIFTFVQTFFLFKNHKLVIDKNKPSVRFGLMHLLATNLCVWFITAITETAEDYNQQKFLNASISRKPDAPKSCYEDMTLARTASPYLFPSTIIYSIIASGILYRMYQYVGVKVTQRWPSHTSLTSSVPHGAVGMDCEKANKGLFSGLLVAVVTLIAIATFFVFESRLNQTTNAIKIFYVTEISLIAITGSCILFGMMKFVSLRFLENFLSLDSVLLVVSLGGAYVYLCFMLISSASKVDVHGLTSILSLVVICVGILESTLQTIFILDGLCRRASNDTQVEAKPGRAVVTFLLVCNLALWVVSMFEMKKNMVVPFHIEFYGILPWNIILHLCVPLFIYFRFHSAICLSKIWYQAYQKEKNF